MALILLHRATSSMTKGGGFTDGAELPTTYLVMAMRHFSGMCAERFS